MSSFFQWLYIIHYVDILAHLTNVLRRTKITSTHLQCLTGTWAVTAINRNRRDSWKILRLYGCWSQSVTGALMFYAKKPYYFNSNHKQRSRGRINVYKEFYLFSVLYAHKIRGNDENYWAQG